MNTQREHHLDKLTSLRFLTAFWVVIYHMESISVHFDNPIQNFYKQIYAYGYAGVSIFFVLSGFVISLANDNWKGWKRYLIGRVTRIYPPHWIVTFTFALVFLVRYVDLVNSGLNSWSAIVPYLTLTQAWIPQSGYFFAINAASWSLSVEIFFYVCFIFLRRLEDKYVYALSIVSYLILLVSISTHHRFWNMGIYWDFFINPIARLPEFLAGMAVYRLYRSKKLPKLPMPKFNFILILAAMMAALAATGAVSRTGAGFKEVFTCSIIPLPFVALLLTALLDRESNSYMNNKTLVLLGEASFALYLIHRSVIYFIDNSFKNTILMNGYVSILFMLFIAALSVCLSVIFYKFIELPITKYLRKTLTEKFA